MFLYHDALKIACEYFINLHYICRYAMRQAKAGRIIMSVDCTDLLNRRHFDPDFVKDSLYLTDYPENANDERSFDEVTVYKHTVVAKLGRSIAIVTYGNGVSTATQAVMDILADSSSKDQISTMAIVDCPYLTAPPKGLSDILTTGQYDLVLFADICKEGPGMPLASMSTILQNRGDLCVPSRVIGAQFTYNPLGTTLTFLSVDDIKGSISNLLREGR